MKKYLKITLILPVISILCILIINSIKDKNGYNISNENNNIQTKEITKYEVINKDNNDKYTIYYYGINSAIIKINRKEYELTEAIKENKITLDKIFNEMAIYAELNDGGTKIYRNNNSNFFNDNYTIIKCHTIDGNKDIYIGDSTMKHIQSFCTFKPTESQIKLQIKTLKILNTTKIKVVSVGNGVSNDVTKKTITDKNRINEIIDIISNLEEDPSNITTSEKNSYNLLMYDTNNNLISTISIWKNGSVGFDEKKGYFFASKSDKNTIKELVEY